MQQKRMLNKSRRWKTEIIQDGEVALARLAETVPHVVLLDLHLPQVSGRTILQHIRTDKRLVNTRVILATADPRTAEMLRDEVSLVLIKPISFIQLRDLASRLRPVDSYFPTDSE